MWRPFLVKDIKIVDKIQIRATKYILSSVVEWINEGIVRFMIQAWN